MPCHDGSCPRSRASRREAQAPSRYLFQAVQAVLAKRAPGDARPEEELDHAVRQIISRAVAPEGVVDIPSVPSPASASS